MTGGTAIILVFLVAYFLILLYLGYRSQQVTKSTREDYFLASRSLGKVHLFMALFATNMTAFSIIGMSGLAYKIGFGAMGFVIGFALFVLSWTYYMIGHRAWLLGRRYGYATQPQLYGDRFQSNFVGVLFLILTLYYTIPYLLLSVMGAGLAMTAMTNNLIPYWLSALLIIAITTFYTLAAGMRGTSWTDVFQGFLFTIVLVIVFIALVGALGGTEEVTQKLVATRPELLGRDKIPAYGVKSWLSFALVPVVILALPQVFHRVMATKDAHSLRVTSRWYPSVMGLTFAISTVLGVWGVVLVPGLQGAATDNVIPILLTKFLNPVMVALGLLAVLAIVKSSLDSQLLSVSHTITEDFILKYFKDVSRGRAVAIGRYTIVIFAILSYVGALIKPAAVMDIAAYAFVGFGTLMPASLAALHWKRCNKWGAISSILVGNIYLHLVQFKLVPASWTFGYGPSVPVYVLTNLVLVVVSLVTKPEPEPVLQKFWDVFDRAFAKIGAGSATPPAETGAAQAD